MNVFEDIRVRIRVKRMQVAQTERHLGSIWPLGFIITRPRQEKFLSRSRKGTMYPYKGQASQQCRGQHDGGCVETVNLTQTSPNQHSE